MQINDELKKMFVELGTQAAYLLKIQGAVIHLHLALRWFEGRAVGQG